MPGRGLLLHALLAPETPRPAVTHWLGAPRAKRPKAVAFAHTQSLKGVSGDVIILEARFIASLALLLWVAHTLFLDASAGGRLLRCWPCSRSVRWCIYTQHRVALADLFLCLSSVVPLLSMQQSVLLCIRRAAAPSTTTTGSTETDCTTATNILSSAPPLAPSAASQYDPGFGEPLQQLAHWSQKAGP